jgi:hypothetical protein
LQFLRAAAAFGAGKPEALGAFLAAHPAERLILMADETVVGNSLVSWANHIGMCCVHHTPTRLHGFDQRRFAQGPAPSRQITRRGRSIPSAQPSAADS